MGALISLPLALVIRAVGSLMALTIYLVSFLIQGTMWLVAGLVIAVIWTWRIVVRFCGYVRDRIRYA